ncbi:MULTISPECIES: hypothetical protein [Oerskovia]|uniref:DUF2591 domain-containing protein n=1 Tax=Oerskovia enterophila TaxID=43678 RepID=A0ABX2XYU4_9CELL|nr:MULTISPECIES: hypothetical protein [Oerskovia]KRC32934.1 hypothetical protein ASE15_14530 [Oerskovia sp. Root22]KRD35898.1 hypothetical protein ASE27_14355 [Oerskovia sp. Root918]OCI29477.1 hypothetical protein OERS_38440 [Oerskovia enterophila]
MKVSTRVEDWQVIDGTLDNTVDIASEDGDAELCAVGLRIRQAGWEACAVHPHRGGGSVGWPPADDVLEVELSRDDWTVAIAQLRRWAAVGEATDDRPEPRLARWLEDEVRAAG